MAPGHHPGLGVSANLVQSPCSLCPAKGLEPIKANLQVLSKWDVGRGQGVEGRQRGRGEKAHSLHAVSPSHPLPTRGPSQMSFLFKLPLMRFTQTAPRLRGGGGDCPSQQDCGQFLCDTGRCPS